MNDLTEFKKDLRSVLIAEKFGININRLNIEFRDLTGNNIYYNRNKYRSLEDYLLTLDDTCFITSRYGETIVCAVTTEKQKELQDLIRGQKSVGPRRPINVNNYSILNSSRQNIQNNRSPYSRYSSSNSKYTRSNNQFNDNRFNENIDDKSSQTQLSATNDNVNDDKSSQTQLSATNEKRELISNFGSTKVFDVRANSLGSNLSVKTFVKPTKSSDESTNGIKSNPKSESSHQSTNVLKSDNKCESFNYDRRYSIDKLKVVYDVRLMKNQNLPVETKSNDQTEDKKSNLFEEEKSNLIDLQSQKNYKNIDYNDDHVDKPEKVVDEILSQIASLFENETNLLMYDNLVEKLYQEKFNKPIDENWLQLISESNLFDVERLKYSSKSITLVGLSIQKNEFEDDIFELNQLADRIKNTKIV